MEDTEKMLATGSRAYGLTGLPVTEQARTELANRFKGLPDASTAEGYEAHRLAIGELTKTRTAVEKRRKELKAEHLEAGRRIDAFAKHVTEIIESIERPIRQAKEIVDSAKERERVAKEEAEKARIEEERRRKQAEEEARLKAIRDAENERLRIEREKIEAERAKLLAEQKKADEVRRIEREKADAERAEIERQRAAVAEEQRKIAEAKDAERRRAEREEFERKAKEKAEKDAAERIEKERIEAEKRAAEKARADKEEAERVEAMRSDVERVMIYATRFFDIPAPPASLKSEAAKTACKQAYEKAIAAGKALASFSPK